MLSTSVQEFSLSLVARLDRWLMASFRFTRRRPVGAVGAAIIGLMIVAAILAGFVSPYDPLATDYGKMLQAPSSSHWFGTDSFGRDVFTRIIYGSRTALWIGFASSFLGATLGAFIGVTSAYFGGKIDLVLIELWSGNRNHLGILRPGGNTGPFDGSNTGGIGTSGASATPSRPTASQIRRRTASGRRHLSW